MSAIDKLAALLRPAVPVVGQLQGRNALLDQQVTNQTGAMPAQAPPQMTPEQQSDAMAVGMGQMKLQDFVNKHGFIPRG